MAKRAAKPDDLDLILNHERTDGQMEASSPRRRSYPRPLIPGAEACRRIKRALGCDGGEALSWLKYQIRRAPIEAHKGRYHLAYHEHDESDEAKTAFFELEHPLSTRDVDKFGELDWSIVSIDEGDLKKALAAEFVDPNEPIGADPPPRPSFVFAVAVEEVRAASGFGEDAARDWLFDALFVQARIPAWTRPTRSYPAWKKADASVDLSLVYVMTDVLKQALSFEFPQAKACPTSTAVPMPPTEHQRFDPESLCLNWLKSEMLKSPDGTPTTKENWLVEAQRQFSDLSRRAFYRAWDRAKEQTGAEWHKAGRKPSR